MKDNFMKEMIQHDFNVRLLSEVDDAIMLAGIRPTYYHLITHSDMCLSQYHIPRYTMAYRLGYLLNNEWNQPDRPMHFELINRRIDAVDFSGGNYGFYTLSRYFKFNGEFSETFLKEVKKDISLLQKAGKMVKSDNTGVFIEGINTPSGSVLRHKDNEDLLIAVAFDYLLSKGKKRLSFGIYELYCNTIDRKYNLSIKDFREMADFLEYVDPEKLDTYVSDAFNKLQEKFFTKPVWGKGIKVDRDDTVNVLKEVHKKMNPGQKVIFKTLFKNDHCFVMLILAFIYGLIDVYTYCDQITGCYQPDSKEEQSIRMDSNMIQLFISLTKTYN